MLEDLTIRNFKQFEEFSIKKLAPITLIGGRNNAGKTSLLEAIYACHAQPEEMFFALNRTRRISPETLTPGELWEPYFFQRDVVAHPILLQWREKNGVYSLSVGRDVATEGQQTEEIRLDSASQGVQNESSGLAQSYPLLFRLWPGSKPGIWEERTVLRLMNSTRASVQRKVPVPAQHARGAWRIKYLGAHFSYGAQEVIRSFGRIELENRKSEVIRAVQIIDSRIEDISTIVTGGQQGRLFATVRGEGGSLRKVPLESMGDGLNRLLVMVISVLTTPFGVVLIDEMENGLHYSIQAKLWETLIRAAKSVAAQIIATTHSDACQLGACEAIEKLKADGDFAEDEFLYLRMAKDENSGKVYARRYDQATFLHAMQNRIEVR